MKLLTHIQQKYGISRRTITDAIKHKMIFINGKVVEGYSTVLKYNDHLTGRVADRVLDDRIQNAKTETKIFLFHKPIGYVCSKFDAHNKTIYYLLGEQYKNYYYVGRLDKDSRGMVMLTNDPAVVHQYEHPKQKVTKEYIVTVHIKGDFLQRLLDGTKDAGLADKRTKKLSVSNGKSMLDKNMSYLFTRGLLVDQDGKLAKRGNRSASVLKVVSIDPVVELDKALRRLGIVDLTPRKHVHTYRIVLNEGKKRHIRRLLSSVGGDVLDLIRVRIGDYELDKLGQEEIKQVM